MANHKTQNKKQNNQPKGDTQDLQPDLRFAIQQTSKAQSERGKAQQNNHEQRFAMYTVV
jgi:non-homologous end joining protein Ku